MLNFNDGLPAIIQPDHATIKSRDRTQFGTHFKIAYYPSDGYSFTLNEINDVMFLDKSEHRFDWYPAGISEDNLDKIISYLDKKYLFANVKYGQLWSKSVV